MTSNSATVLNGAVQDIERLMGDIDAIKEIIKGHYENLSNHGFNPQAVRKLIGIRRKDADKESALLNDLLLYASSTGTKLDVELP